MALGGRWWVVVVLHLKVFEGTFGSWVLPRPALAESKFPSRGLGQWAPYSYRCAEKYYGKGRRSGRVK